jgi:hypothetical protein
MATLKDVHREYGQTAELAQVFETELGNALLALDALDHKIYVRPDPEAAARCLERLDRNTLGNTLSSLRRHLGSHTDPQVFQDAIEARNLLFHRFFPHHAFKIETEDGRDAMVKHLVELRSLLQSAHASAQLLSEILFTAVRVLKKVHEPAH